MGVELGRGVRTLHRYCGEMATDRAKHFCINRYLEVVDELLIGANPDQPTLPNPQNLVSENSTLSTVADGATLCFEFRRYGVIVVANAHISVDSVTEI